jgi:tetratricopeptide (TPR) repeat protein
MRLLIVLVVAACGGAPSKPTLPKQAPAVPADDLAIAKGGAKPVRAGDSNLVVKDPRIVDLDIIRIRVPQVGPDSGGGSVATADLFRLANEAAQAGNALDAIKRYRQIIAEFPDSLYSPVSMFNIAALQDKQGDPAATIATLRDLIKTYPTSRESVEGHLYIAALQSEKQQWTDAVTTLDAALARTNLTYADRVEAHARRGYVLVELKRFDEADGSFAAAVGEWRKAPRIDDTYYIAMAGYYAGEIAHRKFTDAPVRLPDDVLHTDLEQKRVLAVQAYDRWRTSLGYNHAYWGTAAGYQMSQIFVELWEVTVKAPYPTKLAVGAREKYVMEVHDRVRPHLVKALAGHKMNIELAKAYGVETSWSKGSAARVVQVFELLQKDSAGDYLKPTP